MCWCVSVEVSDAVVAVRARTRSGEPAGCTGCGQLSAWCHSRYVRSLADVTLAGRPVRIDLSVRRLYCENTTCPKVTFAEQVPGLTVRYQRRTPLLQHLVEDVGVVLAGRGGSRMLRILNVRLSRCTVLSQLMRVPLPPLVTPRVLGVDDFALYGDTYGTLLVDADTRLPLTLWEGRDAEQLGRWLREHPVSRSPAATARSPTGRASPTAPRKPCRSATAFTCGRACPAEFRTSPPPTADACPQRPCPRVSELGTLGEEPRRGTRRRTRGQSPCPAAVRGGARADRIPAGSYSSAARELGLDRRTVRQVRPGPHLAGGGAPTAPPPSTLDPYLDYLQQRWDEGEHSAKILHQELLTKGYLGHYQRVKMAVAPLRRGLPLDEPRERPPSPRETARWIITATHTAARPAHQRTPAPAPRPLPGTQTAPTTWSAGSPPCSMTATPHPCRTGWTSSATSGLAPLAGPRQQPCAKTSTPSPRGSPPPTTPASTKAASPTSSCRNGSWQDAPASRSSATASS